MEKRTIVWTCDRCERSWTTPETPKSPLYRIAIVSGWQGSVPHPSWEAQWCMACLLEMRVIEPEPVFRLPPEDAPPPAPALVPTLEDMIRAILDRVRYEA